MEHSCSLHSLIYAASLSVKSVLPASMLQNDQCTAMQDIIVHAALDAYAFSDSHNEKCIITTTACVLQACSVQAV